MGTNSAIEWTDHTFNPWIGCTKVSDGCKHCYAEVLMDKRYGKVKWGVQGKRVRTSVANWKKPLSWNRQQWLECPGCHWRGRVKDAPDQYPFVCPLCHAPAQHTRARVFCASLADVFEDKPDQWQELRMWRKDLFKLIEDTPNLDWLLLTKRPELVNQIVVDLNQIELPPNVWIGTSVENQEQANKRIPELLKIPAAVRFLSMEPLLGAVDLVRYIQYDGTNEWIDPEDGGEGWGYDGYSGGFINDVDFGSLYDPQLGIHWVIVGGESGKNARPMHLEWVGDIVSQCKHSSVPVFVKQMGDNPFYDNESIKRHLGKKGNDISKWHTYLQIREVPNA